MSLAGYDAFFSRNLPRARVGQSAAPKSLPRAESKEAAPTVLRARAGAGEKGERRGEAGGVERKWGWGWKGVRPGGGVAGPELEASGGRGDPCKVGAGWGYSVSGFYLEREGEKTNSL